MSSAAFLRNDADAWSGGGLVLRSIAFRATGRWPTVTVGADTLGVRPYPSDSVLVELPDTDGYVTLGMSLDAFSGPIGEIHVMVTPAEARKSLKL